MMTSDMDMPTLNEKICLCKHRSPCEDYALCDITNSFCFPLTDTIHSKFCLLYLAFEKGKKEGKKEGFYEGAEAIKDHYGITKYDDL